MTIHTQITLSYEDLREALLMYAGVILGEQDILEITVCELPIGRKFYFDGAEEN